MRFLIHEMPFETPLNAGILTYTHNNKPTGAKEHWRLTQATADYRILRVDLDGRFSSGDSYLYHVTMTNAGIIERINFKFWNKDMRVVGNLIVENAGITLVREINGERLETTLDTHLPIWFSASMGLSFVGQQQGNALFLNANEQFALQEVVVANELCGEEEVKVGGKVLVGKCRHLSWRGFFGKNNENSTRKSPKRIPTKSLDLHDSSVESAKNQKRTIHLSPDGWVIKMQRPDGLIAQAIRYIQYQ